MLKRWKWLQGRCWISCAAYFINIGPVWKFWKQTIGLYNLDQLERNTESERGRPTVHALLSQEHKEIPLRKSPHILDSLQVFPHNFDLNLFN